VTGPAYQNYFSTGQSQVAADRTTDSAGAIDYRAEIISVVSQIAHLPSGKFSHNRQE